MLFHFGVFLGPDKYGNLPKWLGNLPYENVKYHKIIDIVTI